MRIIDAGLARVGIPSDRTVVTFDRFPNTVAATIPFALEHAVRDGTLRSGMNVLMSGFGAGLTWDSAVVRWS